LHKALKGGSLTSSIGANKSGKSFNSMLPIFTKLLFQIYSKSKILIELYLSILLNNE